MRLLAAPLILGLTAAPPRGNKQEAFPPAPTIRTPRLPLAQGMVRNPLKREDVRHCLRTSPKPSCSIHLYLCSGAAAMPNNGPGQAHPAQTQQRPASQPCAQPPSNANSYQPQQQQQPSQASMPASVLNHVNKPQPQLHHQPQPQAAVQGLHGRPGGAVPAVLPQHGNVAVSQPAGSSLVQPQRTLGPRAAAYFIVALPCCSGCWHPSRAQLIVLVVLSDRVHLM